MRTLSKAECQKWCRTHGIQLDQSKHPELPWRKGRELKIPADAGQRVAQLTQTFQAFAGSDLLVWITEWSVWASGERMHIFDRFRLSYGVSEPLIEKPGHLFRDTEFDDALSVTTLAILFLWDCFVLTRNGRPALWLSHDEIGHFLR